MLYLFPRGADRDTSALDITWDLNLDYMKVDLESDFLSFSTPGYLPCLLPFLMFTLRRVGDASPVHVRHASDFSKLLSRATAEKHGKVHKLKKVGRAMIDAAKDDNRPGWRHTYKREGPNKRLSELLKTPQLLKKETIQFFTGHALESLSMDGLLERAAAAKLTPGTFIEARRCVQMYEIFNIKLTFCIPVMI